MNETDRIVGAMTGMEEFTVADLVRACEASPSTVRTVLRRKADYIDEVGIEETGCRGGRWKRYRLRPDAQEKLAGPAMPKSERVPTDLLAAEELLLSQRAIDADVEIRESLLRRARAFRDEGAERGDLALRDVVSHLGAVDTLIDLVEGEANEDPGVLAAVRDRIEEVRDSSPAGEELSASLEKRLEQSPLTMLSAQAVAIDPVSSAEAFGALEKIVKIFDRYRFAELEPAFSPASIARVSAYAAGASAASVQSAAISQLLGAAAAAPLARIAAGARPSGREIAVRARTRLEPASAIAMRSQFPPQPSLRPMFPAPPAPSRSIAPSPQLGLPNRVPGYRGVAASPRQGLNLR